MDTAGPVCDNGGMRTKLPAPGSAAGAGVAVVALLTAGLAGFAPLGGSLVGGVDGDSGIVLAPASLRLERQAPGGWAQPEERPPEAVVVMRDGTRYSGFLLEQGDEQIVLEVGGIELRLKAAEVGRVDLLPPIRERYERLRASIGEDDIPARINLTHWLVSRGEYALASEEIRGVLKQEPRHPRALELQRLIEAQRALEAAPPAEADADEPGQEIVDPDRRSKDPMPVLSSQEINLIRVYELDLDRLPRIVIKRETVERLIEEYNGDPLIPSTLEGRDDLFRAARTNPRRVLEIIFRLKARHLYSEVQVIDNPRAMQLFRERVHGTWLINACASCHNTRPDAPRGPRFITRRSNSDATVFSNFLILDRYRLPDGTALINYEDPAASPILQLAMPRATSRFPHPDVAAARGWSPVFLSTSVNAYQNALSWIGSMYRPRPEYPIDYPPDAEPPGTAAPPVER